MGIKDNILEINCNRRTIRECQSRISALNEVVRVKVVDYIRDKHPEWLKDAVCVESDGTVSDYSTVEVSISENAVTVSMQYWPKELELIKVKDFDFEIPVKSYTIKLEEIE